MPDCRCPQCWSLAEYMAELTGKDYGLKPAPGHHGPTLRAVENPSMTDITPDELRALLAKKRRKALPWEEDYAA